MASFDRQCVPLVWADRPPTSFSTAQTQHTLYFTLFRVLSHRCCVLPYVGTYAHAHASGHVNMCDYSICPSSCLCRSSMEWLLCTWCGHSADVRDRLGPGMGESDQVCVCECSLPCAFVVYSSGECVGWKGDGISRCGGGLGVQ